MIYIIVLNWNGITDTISCLESLLKLNYKNTKIVVCDNGSTDNSIEKINKWYTSIDIKKNLEYAKIDIVNVNNYSTLENTPGLYIIDIGKNLGYAGGNNVGIKFALNQQDMDSVWILNNDTIVNENSLSLMRATLENDQNIGVCGSRLVYFDDREKLQGLGGLFNPVLCTSKHYKAYERADKIFDNENVSSNIDYVIGASMLIKRAVLESIGGLCEDYFLYYEEIDYCIRAKKLGYRVFVCTESVVYHKEGASTKKNQKGILADYYSVRNRLLISKKFYPKYYALVYLSIWLVLLNRVRRKEFHKAKNVLKILTFRKICNEN
ncbi:glycosyltransferase family 2 protein [Klebsiella grimontii]|uniref:glycosyltransferase family 2 protein n=1 Tax=Klebsiella grimontii TaxID=2058152 RepID=UPI00300C0AB3